MRDMRDMVMVGFLQAQNCSNFAGSWRHPDSRSDFVGFEKPILHGLGTYGFTGRALLHALCDSDPSRCFKRMDARASRSR